MTNWWRNAPLHLKLNLPIQVVLLLLLPIAHVWLMNRFEAAMLENVQQRTQGSATQSLLALNSMMLTGTIGNLDERAVFHSKMSLQHGVVDFHLVRSQAVRSQFGPGLEIEQQGDELDRLAAETGAVQTETASKGNRTLRVVVPFRAQSSFYGTNCLQCHFVPEGTVLGTISLKVDLESEYRSIDQLSMALLAGQIFLQFLLFLLITWLIRAVTRSVVALESTMLKVKENADFTMRADVRGNDEIGLMAQVFNEFVAHIEDLQIRLAEKVAVLKGYYDKTEEELRIGSDIMSRITDAQSTSDPNVRMRIQPATHYSGDIILVARTPANVLHIMLADAVGHGLLAAINLLPLSQVFKAMTRKGFPVARIAEELNLKTNRLMPVDRFIGAAIVSIDFREQVIEVWNGGVPPTILVDTRGTILHEWKSRHVPLGMLSEDEFLPEVEAFHYEDDCQLYVFSDGLPEAESPAKEAFGLERIRQLLQGSPPGERFDELMHKLETHLDRASAHDDVSILMANIPLAQEQKERAQKSGTSLGDVPEPGSWRMSIVSSGIELRYLDVIGLVEQIAGQIRAAAKHYSQLYVILTELFNNALDHGILRLDSSIKQGPDGFENFVRLREERLRTLDSGSIEIGVEKVLIDGRDGVRIRMIDSGNGFDYAAFQVTGGEVAQGQHGRGIALIRSMAYRLEYAGAGNEVTVYYVFD